MPQNKAVWVRCLALAGEQPKRLGWGSMQAWPGHIKRVSCKLSGVKGCQGTASLESLAPELCSVQVGLGA